MAIPDGSRLSPPQRTLADRVCAHARTLDLRVQALARALWAGDGSQGDGRAGYGWLVELDLSDQLAGASSFPMSGGAA
jgi:hypothetical protein